MFAWKSQRSYRNARLDTNLSCIWDSSRICMRQCCGKFRCEGWRQTRILSHMKEDFSCGQFQRTKQTFLKMSKPQKERAPIEQNWASDVVEAQLQWAEQQLTIHKKVEKSPSQGHIEILSGLCPCSKAISGVWLVTSFHSHDKLTTQEGGKAPSSY